MENKNEKKIMLSSLFYELRQFIGLIVLFGCAVGFASLYIMTLKVPPEYASTTSVYITSKQDDAALTNSDFSASSAFLQDAVNIAKSRTVIEKTIMDTKIPYSAGEVSNLMTVTGVTGTHILKIRVQHPDPILAKRVADAAALNTIDEMHCLLGETKSSVVQNSDVSLRTVDLPIAKSAAYIAVASMLFLAVFIMLYCAWTQSATSKNASVMENPIENPIDENSNAMKGTTKKKNGVYIVYIIFVILTVLFATLTILSKCNTDKTPPEIKVEPLDIFYVEGENTQALLEGVSATDEIDGSVAVEVENIYPFEGENTAKVYYVAQDSQNNVARAWRVVAYQATQKPEKNACPQITLSKEIITIKPKQKVDWLSYIQRISDDKDAAEALLQKVVVIGDDFPTDVPGVYEVQYIVTDSDWNHSELATIKVVVPQE